MAINQWEQLLEEIDVLVTDCFCFDCSETILISLDVHFVLFATASLPWLAGTFSETNPPRETTSIQQEMTTTANLLEQMSHFTWKTRHSLQLSAAAVKPDHKEQKGQRWEIKGKKEMKSGSDEWGRGNQKRWMTVSTDEKRKRVRYVLQACARTAVVPAVLALLVWFHVVVLL